MFISPVQFLLHEPYFDLTPIKVIHTKVYRLKFKFYSLQYSPSKIDFTPVSPWILYIINVYEQSIYFFL